MKKLYFLAIPFLLLAQSAMAATTPVCGNVVACGAYSEEPGEDGVAVEVIFAETAQPNEVRFDWIFRKDGVDTGGGVNLIMKFQDDGSFVGTRVADGRLYTSGICRNMACTYGIVPVVLKDGSVQAQTGTFRFTGNELELSVFAPFLKSGDFISKGSLHKK